jgi:hypothetical protein
MMVALRPRQQASTDTSRPPRAAGRHARGRAATVRRAILRGLSSSVHLHAASLHRRYAAESHRLGFGSFGLQAVKVSPPHRPRENGLSHSADASRTNLAAALTLFEWLPRLYSSHSTHNTTPTQRQCLFLLNPNGDCGPAGGDSPEFVTITCTGGVAHPPGYPLLSLVSSLFTRLVTVGSVAWRCAPRPSVLQATP